jgi:site-specific DNA recombinase
VSTEAPTVARIYVRISKASDGWSLGVERQVPPCRMFCNDRNWPVAEVYIDNNTSAYREDIKRDEFERLLADVRADHLAGRRNAIVTWQADRLLRTIEDASAIVAVAKRYQTLIANVDGALDLSTVDGRKYFYELAVAAQYESQLKSERLKLKHEELRRIGRWAGGRRPFGYRVVGTKLHSRKRADCTRSDDDTCPLVECELEIEPREADAIRDAAQRVLSGDSLTGIQREWVLRGIRRPNGGILASQHLRDLLVSPRLTGRRRGQDPEAPPQWPPILTIAEHEQLIAKLGPGRNPVGERKDPGPRVYLLRGVLYCAVERDGQRCGTKLRGKPSETKRRYVCDTRDGGCEGVKVVADAVEEHVRDAVIAAFDDPELCLKIHKRFAEKLASLALEQEVMEQKKTATEALVRLGDDYADGLLTGIQVERATRRLQQRINTAEAKLAGIRQSPRIMVDLPDSSQAVEAAWDEWNLEERRQIIRLAIERVWVKRAGQGKRFTAERVEFDWLT